MKRTVLAVLAAMALAAPASAAPLGIRHDRDAIAVALAGPDVLALSENSDRGAKLVAVPRGGGPARLLLALPKAGISWQDDRLKASAQRVGAIVSMDFAGSRRDEYRVYSGPPSGPLRIVRRTPEGAEFVPIAVSVDGERMLLLEGVLQNSEDEEPRLQARAQILDASGWTPIAWTSGTRVPVAIAGAYAAVVVPDQRVEVADLATGTPLASIPGKLGELDLAPDGRLAMATPDGIKVTSPGQPVSVRPSLSLPHFAGASIAGVDAANRLSLLAPDDTRMALGPPSLVRNDIAADADGIAWLFNGCIRYAAFAGGPGGKGACPGAELALTVIGVQSTLRGNTATTVVRCVTSDTGRCKGRLVARLDYGTPIVGRGTFDLPAGRKWFKVKVRFDRRTVAKLRREHGGSVVVDAKMRDGTVGAGADYSSEFGIEVRDG